MTTANTQPTAFDFSALSLNLRFGLADDGPNSWDRRKASLSALFTRYQPDFITVQEANDFQIDYLATLLADYDYIGRRRPAPSFWQNNITFFCSAWTLTFWRHFYLSTTPEVPSKFEDSRWPRQCTLGMFANRDRKLICVNTHLDFKEPVQCKSAVLIMTQLAQLPSKTPTLLLGDFNATPKGRCYGVFTGEEPTQGLQGPWFKNAAAPPFPGTYHGFEGRHDGEHIDWILYRGCIEPLAYEVIRERFGEVFPSDHYPVFARFKDIRT